MKQSKKKLAPQTAAILEHLLKNGSISNVEAQAVHRCRALPRRIADLKAAGHRIRTTMHRDITGQRYARYEYCI